MLVAVDAVAPDPKAQVSYIEVVGDLTPGGGDVLQYAGDVLKSLLIIPDEDMAAVEQLELWMPEVALLYGER